MIISNILPACATSEMPLPVVAALCSILLFVEYHDDGIFPLLRHLAPPPPNTNDDIEQSPAQGGITVEGDLELLNCTGTVYSNPIVRSWRVSECGGAIKHGTERKKQRLEAEAAGDYEKLVKVRGRTLSMLHLIQYTVIETHFRLGRVLVL